MRTKTYRINNLKIVYNRSYGKWQVRTLEGTTLEEFEYLADAMTWAVETHDFVKH